MTDQFQDSAEMQPGATHDQSANDGRRLLPDGWKSVAGTVAGIALLEHGLRRRSLRGVVTALVGGALVYRTLSGDDRLEQALGIGSSREKESGEEAGRETETSVSRSITVGKPPDELYERWRDPEQFTRVMGHVADITSRDDDRFYWTVHAPMGQDVSWETHVVDEEPGEFIKWESPEDAMLPNEGEVRFEEAAGDRGTIVTLSVTIHPPGGALGNAALKRLGIVPAVLAGEALRRFKSLVETGEIPSLSGNPSTRGRGDLV